MLIRLYEKKDFDEAKRLCGEFVDMIEDLLPEQLYRFEAMSDNGIDYWISEASKSNAAEELEKQLPDHLKGTIAGREWQPAAPLTPKAFYVAEAEQGRLAGFIQGHAEDQKESLLSRWGVVDALFIEESYRGQGLGSELFQTLEKWFAGQGCVAARVDTWLLNTPAVNAYQAMGFIPYYTGFVKEIVPKEDK